MVGPNFSGLMSNLHAWHQIKTSFIFASTSEDNGHSDYSLSHSFWFSFDLSIVYIGQLRISKKKYMLLIYYWLISIRFRIMSIVYGKKQKYRISTTPKIGPNQTALFRI